MKLYDITQEVFNSVVFPGDRVPTYERTLLIAEGAVCNLSQIAMCAHNGTHLDAPWHFLDDGKTIEQLDLAKCVGEAVVAEVSGEVTAEWVRTFFAGNEDKEPYKRILLKGNATVTLEAAKEFNRFGIDLIGNESQTVGPEDAPVQVHHELLGQEVILLEGLSLSHVPAGEYFLSAAPLKLGGAEGAPCRALLIDFKGFD